MVLAIGFLLTVAVVVYVGYPLFVSEPAPAEDALELAIAQRRAFVPKKRGLVCAGCGAANEPGDRFCAHCGRALLERRCGACGEPFDEGDVFCAKCGARLAGRAM